MGHGCETRESMACTKTKIYCEAWLRNTGSPAGLKPKAVPEACGTAKQKAMQGIEGKAIYVWMDRPVPWKSPVEHRGAWLRN